MQISSIRLILGSEITENTWNEFWNFEGNFISFFPLHLGQCVMRIIRFPGPTKAVQIISKRLIWSEIRGMSKKFFRIDILPFLDQSGCSNRIPHVTGKVISAFQKRGPMFAKLMVNDRGSMYNILVSNNLQGRIDNLWILQNRMHPSCILGALFCLFGFWWSSNLWFSSSPHNRWSENLEMETKIWKFARDGNSCLRNTRTQWHAITVRQDIAKLMMAKVPQRPRNDNSQVWAHFDH